MPFLLNYQEFVVEVQSKYKALGEQADFQKVWDAVFREIEKIESPRIRSSKSVKQSTLVEQQCRRGAVFEIYEMVQRRKNANSSSRCLSCGKRAIGLLPDIRHIDIATWSPLIVDQ